MFTPRVYIYIYIYIYTQGYRIVHSVLPRAVSTLLEQINGSIIAICILIFVFIYNDVLILACTIVINTRIVNSVLFRQILLAVKNT